MDPFLVAGTSPIMPVFIFKRELMWMMPPIFLLGWIYGHVPIRRGNREVRVRVVTLVQSRFVCTAHNLLQSAIKSLNKARMPSCCSCMVC
jgi:1-acyl-sn-glycerol-3-phosphate acyltransferase